MPIPQLGPSGILPPYVGAVTQMASMSPYAASLVEVAQRFCLSDPRKEILRGLLLYRQRLGGLGFNQGMQWLSGSFLEDIETLEQRVPRDVDVVTFCHLPAATPNPAALQALMAANQLLFDHGAVKANFKVDAQFVDLGFDPQVIVAQARFWFGLFSHRRNGIWKGMVQIPLALSADDIAAAQLVGP